jgi:DNA ligase-4
MGIAHSYRVLQTASFVPALRVLVPGLDKGRGAYGIRQARLASLYVGLLGLSKTSPDALKLVNYR